MLPCLFAAQAWTALQASRKRGSPKFRFDREGISCDSGKLHTSASWSGVNRIRLTRRTCFIYLSPRCAWFFGRDELTPEDESLLFDFAKSENVKFHGGELKQACDEKSR
ncbi:YcxB family protein [Rhodanobacter sp. BL-MT-08]